MKLQTKTLSLSGTNYEIRQKLGHMTAAVAPLKAVHCSDTVKLNPQEFKAASDTLDRFCPGLTEELQGFADALKTPVERVFFYGMTYLVPRCSQIAVPASLTKEGRPLIARNYEFNNLSEDFCLMKTSVNGKYTHMGTSVLHFGRDDGFNEHGLSVTMSSCGFPVGPLPYMRQPKFSGLQYWAVIRTLLENCKTISEALLYVKELPISFNINLLLVDKTGDMALVETFDGDMAVKHPTLDEATSCMYATNHPILDEIIDKEPLALRHSMIRYDWISKQLAGNINITPAQLKSMLLSKFPEGLTCHFYDDFFGTTKSMLIDPACGTIDLCWGGDEKNGWKQYQIADPLPDTVSEIEIQKETFNPVLAEYVPIK